MIYDLGVIAGRPNVFTLAVDPALIGAQPDIEGWKEYLKGRYGDDLDPRVYYAILDGHTHNFGHLTVVMRGSFVLFAQPPGETRWGKRILSAAPAKSLAPAWDHNCWFDVPADWKHLLVATTELSETACLYSWRNETGEVVERMDPRANYEWVTG